MKTYRVRCYYRNDDGMSYSVPTTHKLVTVQADNDSEARHKAIEELYASALGSAAVSHVTPRIESVTE